MGVCRKWGIVIQVLATQFIEFLRGLHPPDRYLESWIDAIADVNEGFLHPLHMEEGIERRVLAGSSVESSMMYSSKSR